MSAGHTQAEADAFQVVPFSQITVGVVMLDGLGDVILVGEVVLVGLVVLVALVVLVGFVAFVAFVGLVLFKSVGVVTFLLGVVWPTLPDGSEALEGVGLQYRRIGSQV